MTDFTYWGKKYELFGHPYNDTITNERAVEVPVALGWLPPKSRAGVLEVGAVLCHYGCTGQRIVDLHEHGDGIDNIDVMAVTGSYKRIVSVSTIEHTTDPVATLDHMRTLLASGGRMLVTVPGGFHPGLDAHLAGGAGTTRCCTLSRATGTWVQTDTPTFLPYGSTGWCAASVWIGEWT